MATCLNQINPRSGFVSDHSQFCAYPHLDGELAIQVAADCHIHFHVSKDRPNGLSCMNVCTHHSEYSRDQNGKEHKRNEAGVVINDHPIIDGHALVPAPARVSLKTSTSMASYRTVESSTTTTDQGDTNMTKKKATSKKKAASPTDSNDPDVKKLAAKQDESDERLSAGTTVKLFKRINKATKKKPVVHRTLNLYDKRLARELARLGLVSKEDIDGVGLSYYPI